jgi:hypothetical protein
MKRELSMEKNGIIVKNAGVDADGTKLTNPVNTRKVLTKMELERINNRKKRLQDKPIQQPLKWALGKMQIFILAKNVNYAIF